MCNKFFFKLRNKALKWPFFKSEFGAGLAKLSSKSKEKLSYYLT